MKYLDLKTSQYLESLGCTSESETVWKWNGFEDERKDYFASHRYGGGDFIIICPAYSLEDILRKDNAEKVWPDESWGNAGMVPVSGFKAQSIANAVRNHPETWPEEISKMILAGKESKGTS
jgi:hypothetical protein